MMNIIYSTQKLITRQQKSARNTIQHPPNDTRGIPRQRSGRSHARISSSNTTHTQPGTPPSKEETLAPPSYHKGSQYRTTAAATEQQRRSAPRKGEAHHAAPISYIFHSNPHLHQPPGAGQHASTRNPVVVARCAAGRRGVHSQKTNSALLGSHLPGPAVDFVSGLRWPGRGRGFFYDLAGQ